jgi:hypothetical protein
VRAALSALRAGARRLTGGWRYLVLAYAGNLLLAAVLGATLMSAIATSIGPSLAGTRLRRGFDSFWFNSFSAQATGVASTFHPSVTGAGAVFDALDSFLSGFDGFFAGGLASNVLPVAVLYLVWWTFLGGGFISACAAPGESWDFARRAVRVFPRMLALSAVGLVFYALLLVGVRPALDLGVYLVTRESTDERVFFAWTLGAYLGLWIVVWAGNMVLDYAKIALVRQRGIPALAAPFRAVATAVRLVARRPRETALLYGLNGAVWVATLLVYWAVVPGADHSSAASIAAVFLLGQTFVFSRVGIRCWFLASETALFGALQDGAPALAQPGCDISTAVPVRGSSPEV